MVALGGTSAGRPIRRAGPEATPVRGYRDAILHHGIGNDMEMKNRIGNSSTWPATGHGSHAGLSNEASHYATLETLELKPLEMHFHALIHIYDITD